MAFEYPRIRRLGVAPIPKRTPALLSPLRSLPFRIPSSQHPGDRLPSPPHHHQAMDLFPDGGFVRLQKRQRGKYVHADEDWEGVSLRPSDGAVPSLNSVWRGQHWVSPLHGDTYVLLQNAAYGRYLSFSLQKASFGHRGYRTAQLDRSEDHELNAYAWTWSVERLPHPDQDYVRLSFYNCNLRANGRYLTCNIGVTAEPDLTPRISTMMHWTVHGVAASQVPQPLPLTLEDPDPVGNIGIVLFDLFPHPPRLIRHVRANDEGEFDQNHNNWHSFVFYDSSVDNLLYELGQLQNDWIGDPSAFTLPGLHGRLMPLVTDLPRSLDTMNIVVLRTGSPAALALVYPAPPDAAAA